MGKLITCLVVIFLLSASFAFAAPTISISVDNASPAPNQNVKITVQTDPTAGRTVQVASFTATATGASSSCTPVDPGTTASAAAGYYSCTVNFSSTAAGTTYTIRAGMVVGNQTYTSNTVTVTISKAAAQSVSSTYNFLAPFVCDQSTPGCTNGELTAFNPGQANALSIYLNIMIKIAIGVAAVLAVVMIVMGGIQYMTSELISSKEEGRHRITNALIGLLIALGAYLILYTINPNLLKTIDVSDTSQLPSATIALTETPPLASDFDSLGSIPTGATSLCSQGISTPDGIAVCGSIASNVKALVDLARSQGLNLSGWGWRSTATQISLRQKNGCPDIYNSPPSACRVPTAIPGTSMHEKGLAVDFTCDGVAIQSQDNKCFLFLQKYAGSYGLRNYAKEPWHWSTTGS